MKRKARWFALILLIGIPTCLTCNALHREQASRNLIQAIHNEDVPAALVALQNGANPNARDYSRDKPLSFGENMKLFLAHLSHPNADPTSDMHPTPLQLLLNPIYNERKEEIVNRFGVRVLRPYIILNAMFLDEQVSLPLVKALLDAGADPNIVDEENETLLMLSELNEHPKAGHLLLLHGANVHKKDSSGRTALHWTARNGTNAAIDTLLAAGADINAKDDEGDTPLQLTFENSDDSATYRSLLRHHADVKTTNNDGNTPLHASMKCAEPELTDLLLAAGADINAKNKSGWTPLHTAVTYQNSYRNIEVVRELLRHKANLCARTLEGKTPLDTARDAEAGADVIQALKRAGGKTGAELDALKQSDRQRR